MVLEVEVCDATKAWSENKSW